ncbi:Nucleotide-sugar transporter [Nesidiocoris tenuis]|uniref:Nucleotide-sugar transporter n=1 Tax=Nesidiocoris tenuis TaxID=355587 RepID=A0ABN7A9I0_9HEMI|nr:Nucleotide-sugar transporter [Nesidiocoris tenuis]
MAWTSYQVLLAVVMVTTGSINTLTTKWADKLDAKGSDGKSRPFDHPFVQSACMFLGEFLCLVVFKTLFFVYSRRADGTVETNTITAGSQEFSPFILFPAAMCDMIGTSLMYVGLNLTNPSSFQMLRGSVIVFVALLSVAFLRRQIVWRQWLGIAFVILGLAVVGFSDFQNSSGSDNNNEITGDLIIVIAQIITATQMVYEEKFVNTKNIPPLQAVGWEGLFGLVVTGLLLIPFYFIHVPERFGDNAHGVLEDLPDALIQMGNNKLIIVSLIGTIISIAFFNFAGISVTKELSATTRMILDSVRTLVIWGFSLIVKWQGFHILQIPGFILLILGMCIYNNLLPSLRSVVRCFDRRSNSEVLIDSEATPNRD